MLFWDTVYMYNVHVGLYHRHTGQFFRGGGWAIVARNFFDSARNRPTAMLTCKISLPDSPPPNQHTRTVISKNPGFRALYLARRNEFRFFV